MNDSESSLSGLPHSMTLTLGLTVLDLTCSRKVIVLLDDAEPLSFTQPISLSPRKAVMKEHWTRLPSSESWAPLYTYKLGHPRPVLKPL